MSQFPYQVAGPPQKPSLSDRLKKAIRFLSPLHNTNHTAIAVTFIAIIGVVGVAGYGATRIIALNFIPQSQIAQNTENIQKPTNEETATPSNLVPGEDSDQDSGTASTPSEQSSTPSAPPAANAPNQPIESPTDNPVTPAPVKRTMNTAGSLLSWDFNTAQPGVFTAARANETFNNANGRVTVYSVSAPDSLYVEKDGNDNYLVKKMPKGSYNARSGSPLRHSMAIDWRLNNSISSGYFAYNFKTSPNFDGVKGGKMPGLCGGTCPSGGDQTTDAPRLADGGNNPAGKAIGWSGRNMWQTGGYLIQYFYHPNQTTKFAPGYSYRYASGGRTYINDNKWHSIEHYIKMNTPGKTDGVFQAWFDGTRVLNLQKIRFRDDTGYAIDMLMFSVFFGGGDASFATTKDEYLYFDDFVLSRNPITH